MAVSPANKEGIRNRLRTRWQRACHVRGHGVHSPFAYRMVTDVIRPRPIYGYYGYHDIDSAVEGAHREFQTPRGGVDAAAFARLVLRLAVALRPDDAFVSPYMPKAVADAVAAAGRNIMVSRRYDPSGFPSLAVAEASHPIVARAGELLSRDGAILVVAGCAPEVCADIFARMGEGLLLEAQRYAVFFSRAGMYKQHILI